MSENSITLPDIAEILSADILVDAEPGNTVEFKKCGGTDLMSDLLNKNAENSIFLTGLATIQTIRTASIAGVGVLVFVRGKIPPDEVIDMARDEGIPLLSTACSMFVSCGRLYEKGLAGLGGNR